MRILCVHDLPQSCKIEGVSLNLDYLKNKTSEIVFNAYLISILEIVSRLTSKGNGALMFISGYSLAVLCG